MSLFTEVYLLSMTKASLVLAKNSKMEVTKRRKKCPDFIIAMDFIFGANRIRFFFFRKVIVNSLEKAVLL